jgi:hypothetical protein
MAGTIAADTLTHSTAGSLTTDYVVNGSAKAWALSASGASPPLDSFNVSGVIDNSTGNYDFTLSSAMGSNNFVVAGMATGLNKVLGTNRGSNTTTNIHVEVRNQATTLVDSDAQPAIFGDLA